MFGMRKSNPVFFSPRLTPIEIRDFEILRMRGSGGGAEREHYPPHQTPNPLGTRQKSKPPSAKLSCMAAAAAALWQLLQRESDLTYSDQSSKVID